MNGLPTPRTTLRARYVSLLVWCKGGCQHQAEADLQALIDAGRGDVPLTRLKFRCSNCGSDRTDFVVTVAATTRSRGERRETEDRVPAGPPSPAGSGAGLMCLGKQQPAPRRDADDIARLRGAWT